MARGYCPNQECPNIDVLDAERPCPTCGRDVRELSPREYWRTRTIKMMHAHEIAEIAEIQEVARRGLGEASVVPKTLESEDTSPREEQEIVDEVSSTFETETLITPEESAGGPVELVSGMSEVESVGEIEELSPFEMSDAIRQGELGEEKGEEELVAATLVSELPSKDEGEIEESKADVESGGMEPEVAERFKVEIPEVGGDGIDERNDTSTAADLVETGVSVTEEASEVDDVPFVEGLVGAKAELEYEEEESVQSELRQDEETLASGEVSEAQEIAEFEDRGESPGEAADAELTDWKRSEALQRESAEEVSAPLELPTEGGVERPASPVRIITFREGGTEIGICPYCGRFVRGSDLARHKLKHRVRNALGLQAGD